MQHTWEKVLPIRSVFGIAGCLLAVVAMGGVMAGCSVPSDNVLPSPLESRVSSNGTADDHLAAAMLYHQEAQRLQTEASKYDQQAAAIKPLEDPKGFRRNALIRTAESLRAKAAEMQQLYATHQTKAETMMGMQPRQ